VQLKQHHTRSLESKVLRIRTHSFILEKTKESNQKGLNKTEILEACAESCLNHLNTGGRGSLLWRPVASLCIKAVGRPSATRARLSAPPAPRSWSSTSTKGPPAVPYRHRRRHVLARTSTADGGAHSVRSRGRPSLSFLSSAIVVISERWSGQDASYPFRLGLGRKGMAC
jgi:hypothetical protein